MVVALPPALVRATERARLLAFPGLEMFLRTQLRERQGVNPKTLETVTIPVRTTMRFLADRHLRQRVAVP